MAKYPLPPPCHKSSWPLGELQMGEKQAEKNMLCHSRTTITLLLYVHSFLSLLRNAASPPTLTFLGWCILHQMDRFALKFCDKRKKQGGRQREKVCALHLLTHTYFRKNNCKWAWQLITNTYSTRVVPPTTTVARTQPMETTTFPLIQPTASTFCVHT